jgi:heat shock gene repressor HrcA
MDLDERDKRVLQAVIDSYISSGAPIGSTVLVRRYDFGLSSATLRNIMAELEDLGYLTHPHTSAGRIPTDRGYRYYIDSLISVENETEDIEDHLRQAPSLHGMTFRTHGRGEPLCCAIALCRFSHFAVRAGGQL